MNRIMVVVFLVTVAMLGGMIWGYGQIMASAPIAIAQAQAAVIEARSDALIEQMYAAENVARMTQAREQGAVTAQVTVGVITGVLAFVVAVVLVALFAVSWRRVHRIGSVSGTRMIDGELWHVVGQDGEWFKLERVSQYELAERGMK